MKPSILSLIIVLLFSVAVLSDVDNNPISNGNTQTRNALGRTFEGAIHNPAVLGVERIPKGGMPFPASNLGIGIWSDKLCLTPLIGADFNKYSLLTSEVLTRSFDLYGLDESEVSKKLTEELKGGARAYAGARASLLSYAWNRFAFDITTHMDAEIQIPEGFFHTIFSETHGLLRGNTLDFSGLREEAIWATDFTFSIGLPVYVPALHNFFKLRYGAGGLSVKYIMGHSILKSETEMGSVEYSDATNDLDFDGKIKIKSAGTGFYGNWDWDSPFSQSILPVTGHGIGVDLGGILYDEHGTMVINFHNIGVLFWMKDVKEVSYEIDKNHYTAYDYLEKDDDDFIESDDSMKTGNGFATLLPLSVNIGYSYSWDLSRQKNQKLRYLAEYANASANYEQQLSKSPGRRMIPRLSIGGEAGTLRGYLPVRLGLIFGGPELIASAVGAGIDFKYVSANASYKAVGSPFLVPKRGLELAVGLNFAWGMEVDTDKDGIPDNVDKCPRNPEDPDGFEDKDGCPDYDNDNDGIPDSLDNCPNVAEDKDNFEDGDGCPDTDNDGDGIEDVNDKCPMEPEDKDNFQDDDGCPDFDNDGDGIPDSLDKCPNLPEDIDLFEDDDGCPDYDNDKDGIADTVDNCISEPETYNGYKDDDGCPDTLIRPSEKETTVLNTKLRAINFKTGSAELLPVSFAALDFIADFLKQYSHLRYEIQGHTDDQGSDEYNLVLSAARAGTVRAYLLSKGIPESSILAIGYGETMPIADNKTANGRALNRRVEFKIIESEEDYQMLKTREEVFREKVKNSKIKGARF